MKRKILALAGLVIFAAMLAWGTIAYFAAEDQAINVLTIGSVDIEIVEYDIHGNPVTPDSPPTSFCNIEPGQHIFNQVAIKNRGENTAWIRAKIIDTITSTNGDALDESVLTYNVNDLNTPAAQTAEGIWVKENGYFYFDQPIAPGKTAVLFDVVSFNGPLMGNTYQGCSTRIQVLAQAVQYEGNESCDSASWPAEPEHVSPDSQFVVSGGDPS